MNLTIVTATPTEANAVRKAMPGTRVIVTGMGLRDYRAQALDAAVICGVAGGLRSGVPTGTVVIASEVRRPDGSAIAVDADLTRALEGGARKIGLDPLVAPLLAADELVTGVERAVWAQRGCVAVDMESGGITAARLAVVRVILDTPEREISPEWLQPLRASLTPRLWPELLWLARNAPRCARRAAEVASAGFGVANQQHDG